MITLPDNWEQTIRISPPAKCLYLHFKNDANQYYTYFQVMDPAFNLDEILMRIDSKDRTAERAYVLNQDLTTEFQEPLDQNWQPAPVVGPVILSIEQYRRVLQTEKQ